MKYTLKIKKTGEFNKYKELLPVQIARASRCAVNKVTSDLQKELGSAIPKADQTNVAGYKKVRSKKRKVKARRKSTRASVWMGTMRIPAKYAGKPRYDKSRGGVRIRGHFFENSFIAKMKSGYVGVFNRNNGKLEQDYVELLSADRIAKKAAGNAQIALDKEMLIRLERELNKKRGF